MAEPTATPNAQPSGGTPSGTSQQAAAGSGGGGGSPAPVIVQGGGNGAATPAPTLAEAAIDDKAVATPAAFPERWREIAADGDEKALKRLQRFTSPVTFFKSWKSAQDKISSGEHVRSRPQSTTPDDPAHKQALAEWRAEAGVPEKPEGYLDNLPKGLIIGEHDKAIAESFLADMHGQDAPPPLVHKALEWYHGAQEKLLAERSVRDKETRAETEDRLRNEMGNEFRGNINNIHAMLDMHGAKGVKDKLFAARTADGTAFGDDYDVLTTLTNIAKLVNPHGTIVPTGDKGLDKALDAEIADAEKRMSNPRQSGWFQDEKAQARYRELLEMRERVKARG